jgi:hypothetical protein
MPANGGGARGNGPTQRGGTRGKTPADGRHVRGCSAPQGCDISRDRGGDRCDVGCDRVEDRSDYIYVSSCLTSKGAAGRRTLGVHRGAGGKNHKSGGDVDLHDVRR